MFAVTARFRWPICSPIRAHGTPVRWSRLIRRWRRSCGENAGHPGRDIRPRDLRPEAVAAEALEHAPLRRSIIARDKLEHRGEDLRRHLHPTRPPRLRHLLSHA